MRFILIGAALLVTVGVTGGGDSTTQPAADTQPAPSLEHRVARLEKLSERHGADGVERRVEQLERGLRDLARSVGGSGSMLNPAQNLRELRDLLNELDERGERVERQLQKLERGTDRDTTKLENDLRRELRHLTSELRNLSRDLDQLTTRVHRLENQREYR
jgi:chromosome segregation ATPase